MNCRIKCSVEIIQWEQEIKYKNIVTVIITLKTIFFYGIKKSSNVVEPEIARYLLGLTSSKDRRSSTDSGGWRSLFPAAASSSSIFVSKSFSGGKKLYQISSRGRELLIAIQKSRQHENNRYQRRRYRFR